MDEKQRLSWRQVGDCYCLDDGEDSLTISYNSGRNLNMAHNRGPDIARRKVGSVRRDYRTGTLSTEGNVSSLMILGYYAESVAGLPNFLMAEAVEILEECERRMRRRVSD